MSKSNTHKKKCKETDLEYAHDLLEGSGDYTALTDDVDPIEQPSKDELVKVFDPNDILVEYNDDQSGRGEMFEGYKSINFDTYNDNSDSGLCGDVASFFYYLCCCCLCV